MEIRKINDRLPFDFSLSYEFGTKALNTSFRAEDFTLRDLLSLTGDSRKYNPFLGVKVNSAVSLTRSPDGSLFYKADLAGSSPKNGSPGYISFNVAARGNEKDIHFSRCDIDLPQGRFRYAGGIGFSPLSPNGILSVSDFTLTGDGAVNGEISISSSPGGINLFGESLTSGSVLLSALDGNFIRGADGFTFSLSALRFQNMESYENVRLSSANLDGFFDYDPLYLQGSIALDSFSVADLLEILRPVMPLSAVPDMVQVFSRDLSISTEIFINTDFEHNLYNIPRLVAAYSGGGRDFFLLASVSGTDRRFELSESRITWINGSVGAAGFADFSNPDDIRFSLQASYEDASYYLEGTFLDRQSLSIRGSYGFNVYCSAASFGGYSGYIEAASIPIPFGGEFARLSMLIILHFDSIELWSANVERFELHDLMTPVSSAAVFSLSGNINQNGLFFPRIFFDDGQGVLNGRASASWGAGLTEPSGSLVVTDRQGVDLCRIEGTYRRKTLDLSFSGTELELDRIIKNAHGAVLTGLGRFQWQSADSYAASITLTRLSAKIGETEFTVSGSASLDQEEIYIPRLFIDYRDIRGEVNDFRANLRDAVVSARAKVNGSLTGRIIDTSFSANCTFNPIASWFDIQRAVETFDGALTVENFQADTINSKEPFDFVFARTPSLISLSGGPGGMIRMQISNEGDFYTAFSNPAPIRGAVTGTVTPTTIDAQAADLYVDLASLWNFIPKHEIVNLTGGYVVANVQIRGSLGDPEFYGTARGNSVRIMVPQYVRAEIEPVPVTVVLEGNEMRFGPIPARVRNGAGTVQGWFRFDRWIPNIFNLDIQVPQRTPIPFGIDIAGIMADGDASGHLALSMENYVFSVTGDLVGQNTEINLDVRQISQGVQSTMSQDSPISVVTDLRITSGSKVEFVYPTRDLPMLRAYTAVGTGIRVTSDSLSSRYTVTGDVALRSGEIFYFQRSFYIREGTLVFNESDSHFDPLISARAEVRDRTDEGPVTISMIVENAPLISFTPRFESNPSLSQIDIFSILGQNFVSDTAENQTELIRDLAVSSSDFLAQFYLYRRAERLIRDFLRLDMFSARTQVLQNWLFYNTGIQDPVDRIGGVGNYFDNTTVFLGKYFGPDVFGQAMFSFRYDENRTDVGLLSEEGLSLGSGVSLEADIGVEIQGPIFDFQLNFSPRHLENMFVNDLSITILWRRSVYNLSDLWKEF
jgi:hypothetical protein